MVENGREIGENATLESVGVGAMAVGITLMANGKFIEGCAVAALSVLCFVVKYARRRWGF